MGVGCPVARMNNTNLLLLDPLKKMQKGTCTGKATRYFLRLSLISAIIS